MDVFDGKQWDVWVYDWARDTFSRLTADPADDSNPVWTPDGQRIVFASDRADKATRNLYWQQADGTGDVQRLTNSKSWQFPGSWHPSGKFLAFLEGNPQKVPRLPYNIMILPMEGDEFSGWRPGTPTVFHNTPFNEFAPMFSPDGRWLAYVSAESGRAEVYVRPFPGPGSKWQISNEGGGSPTWSRTRHELFYSSSSQIMVTSYTIEGDRFHANKPQRWSEGHFASRPPGLRFFDLHPDGERFAVAKVPDQQNLRLTQDNVVFIFNFFDELRRIAPVKH